MEPFRVEWSAGVISVAGEVDLACAPRMLEAILAAGPEVLVDMSEVTFMDSTGISVLVEARNTLTAGGGSLKVSAVSGPVQRVLAMTGMDDLFS